MSNLLGAHNTWAVSRSVEVVYLPTHQPSSSQIAHITTVVLSVSVCVSCRAAHVTQVMW